MSLDKFSLKLWCHLLWAFCMRGMITCTVIIQWKKSMLALAIFQIIFFFSAIVIFTLIFSLCTKRLMDVYKDECLFFLAGLTISQLACQILKHWTTLAKFSATLVSWSMQNMIWLWDSSVWRSWFYCILRILWQRNITDALSMASKTKNNWTNKQKKKKERRHKG